MDPKDDTAARPRRPAGTKRAPGPDRSSAIDQVLRRLEQVPAAVHVQGAPGFGKRNFIDGLAERLDGRAIVVRLADEVDIDSDPLERLWLQLDRDGRPASQLPGGEWQARLAAIAQRLGEAGERPTLIIADADHLQPVEPDGRTWPGELLQAADLVTVSLAPLHLIFPYLSREAAAAMTVGLELFPPQHDGFDDFDGADDRPSQSEDEYLSDGEAWFSRYLNERAVAPDMVAPLTHVFTRKYRQRRQELWDGHPLVNVAALEAMLDWVLAGGRAQDALDEFRESLSNARFRPLGARLLPFAPGSEGSVAPAVAEAIAGAVKAHADQAALDSVQQEWLLASGLCVGGGAGTLPWSKATTLLARDPNSPAGREQLLRWARETLLAARRAKRIYAERQQQNDSNFRFALDRVNAVFCEGTRAQVTVERQHCRIIVPEKMFLFRLSETAAETDPRKKGNPASPEKFDLLVFDTTAEGGQYWRHQIRILSTLGRMRHPALRAFGAGGELRTDDDEAAGESPLVFIEVTRALEDPGRNNVRELLRQIDESDPDCDEGEAPRPAFAQIVLLAEALDLIHAQGIIHRTLDFSALQVDRSKDVPQLVLTGFEYSAYLRSNLQGPHNRPIPEFRQAGWNLACRAPEWNPGRVDEVDPAIDVYAFGALACMLATGLPDEEVLIAVDLALPTDQQLADEVLSHEASRSLHQVRDALREDLLRDDRWTALGEEAGPLRDLVHRCLKHNPAERPTMEELAPQLSAWHQDYLASFIRNDGELHVSYPTREMGDMLKKLRLIDENKNLENPKGEAWLRTKIQEWIDSAKWMHYRESGFPRGGKYTASRVRRESRYILAGPSVVFFAALYRETQNAPPDDRVLWLSYAMRQKEIMLPDPVNSDRTFARATDEEISWVPQPAKVRVVAKSDIPYLDEPASWEPTLAKLRKRASSSDTRRLGREAATVWRIHRDIELAREAIRSFPVTIKKAENADGYVAQLDIEAFTRANEQATHAFLRQVLLEGKNERAFFVDTVQALAEAAGESQLSFLIRGRGKDRRTHSRSLIGTVELPLAGEAISVHVDHDKDAQVPEQAEIVWFDRFGTEVAAIRQSQAIERLERRTWLLDYLVTPRDCGRLRRPISGVCGKLIDGPSEHVEKFKETVKRMMSSDPLHAVQGPPGTGKTTLIAALVAEVLAANDGARILVTSQNHSATDNVVLAVTDALDKLAEDEDREGTVALRLFSESTRDQVDHEVRRRYSIDAQVREAEKRMLASATNARHGQRDDSHLAKACDYLARAAKTGYLETRFKIERSSALIFSTTGAAMTSLDYLKRGSLGYDYVLIDEAAKAWAVDLVQPLAIADRAILVGDQDQLPPFGDLEIQQILTNARERRRIAEDLVPPDFDELLETSGQEGGEAPFVRMQGWLKLFHRLFDKAALNDGPKRDKPIPLTQSLNRQFRSVPAIGSLISETFYQRLGGIENAGPNPVPASRLPIVRRSDGQSLRPAILWLDTSELTGAYSQRVGTGLRNDGEVTLVGKLLAGKLDLGRDKDKDKDNHIHPWERLRILSPYKEQVNSLRRYLKNHCSDLGLQRDDIDGLVQTVDGSQGSEADIVVISFCRRLPPTVRKAPSHQSFDRKKDDLKNQVNGALGFLQLPERANVMMSRARQQLVLVGDFEFFKRGAGVLDEWLKLSDHRSGEPSFWTHLLRSFQPYDEMRDRADGDLERAIVIPVRAVEGLD